MSDLPRYEPTGVFAVSGRTLNELADAVAAKRLLEGPGYLVDRSPQGQRLRLLGDSRLDLVPPWSLRQEEDGKFEMLLGSVLLSPSSYETEATISGGEALEIAAAEAPCAVYLETTQFFPGEIELKVGEWDGFPNAYEFTVSTGDEGPVAESFDAYRYPLWWIDGQEAAGPRSVRIGSYPGGEPIFARRLVSWDLMAAYSVYEERDETSALVVPPTVAPVFVPAPGVCA